MVKYKKEFEESFHEEIERIFKDSIGNKKVREISFQVTEDCCLACTYCYQHHKTNNKMSFKTAKIFIDNLLTDKYDLINTNNTFGIILDFIGGEPFLQIDLIQQIWEYIYYKMIEMQHPWAQFCRMSICSNGILIKEPKVSSFLKKYHDFISLSISIDGNKELHDSCRLDFCGNGSYDRAMDAVHICRKELGLFPGTKMTYSPDNISHVYDGMVNLIQEGYTSIPSNCIYEKGWEIGHAQIFYKELKKLADYIIDNKINEKVAFTIFDEDIGEPMEDTEDNNKNWCGGIADEGVAIDWQGNFYPCIRYMESSLNGRQEPLSFGNVCTGYLSTEKEKEHYKMLSNITRKSQSTKECLDCSIQMGCAWCSAYNYEEFGTVNKRATYICDMHKARCLANVYYWNKIYKKYNINKLKNINLSRQECLKIISEKEYNLLYNYSK